jgi:hypothetical protein
MTPDMAVRTRQLFRHFMDEYFGEHDIASVVVERGLATTTRTPRRMVST